MAKYRILAPCYLGSEGKEQFYSEQMIVAAEAGGGIIVDGNQINGIVRPGIDLHLELVEGDQDAIDKGNHARMLAEARAKGIDWVDESSTLEDIQGAIIADVGSKMFDNVAAPGFVESDLSKAARRIHETKMAQARFDDGTS